MKDLLALALVALALILTLVVVWNHWSGQGMNWGLFGIGVASWITGAVLWRER